MASGETIEINVERLKEFVSEAKKLKEVMKKIEERWGNNVIHNTCGASFN